MRWRPPERVCVECGFDWEIRRPGAVAIVAAAPEAVSEVLRVVADPVSRRGNRWSAAMYVWHLVDILRIGAERLLTVRLDPAGGIPCWDENELAEVRKYEFLPVTVGLEMLRFATRDWLAVASTVADTEEVLHPEFGSLDALDIVRRNAHEVLHHTGDVAAS